MADEQVRTQEVERSLASVESQLRAQVASIQSSTRVVLVVGIILIAFIFGYLMFLTSWIKKEMTPQNLVESAAGFASEGIERAETALTDQENVQNVITNLREQLEAQIPRLRDYAEERALAALDGFTADLEERIDTVVSDLIEQNKDELKPLIEAASTDEGTDALREEFKKKLEEMIGPEMDEYLAKFDQAMDAVSTKLDKLMQDQSQLTPEELLEKEIITSVMIFLDDTVAQQTAEPKASTTMSTENL